MSGHSRFNRRQHRIPQNDLAATAERDFMDDCLISMKHRGEKIYYFVISIYEHPQSNGSR